MTVKLGCVTNLVASSTEMATDILQKNDQAFLGRPFPDAVTAETDYEHSMAWLSGGPQWRKLRKLCNSQVFTTQIGCIARTEAPNDGKYGRTCY